MENNFTKNTIHIDQIIEDDGLLSILKDKRQEFSLADICLPSNPKESGFLFIKNEKLFNEFSEISNTKGIKNCFVICDQKISESVKNSENISTCIASPNIELSIARASKKLFDVKFQDVNQMLDGRISGTAIIHPGATISPLSFIGENVQIGNGVYIYPNCYIGSNSVIKRNSTIFPQVVVYPFVQIGEGCRIHSGTVIGSDGFGYTFNSGVHQKIWHIGSVIIENNVEIGANTCVDSGTFLPTIIGEGSIIDNQVQVGHNTQLGKGVILCGQSGTGGSSKIGNFSVFGGRSAIAPQCEVGDKVKVAGGGMVTKNWGNTVELAGHPARPLKEWLRNLAIINKLYKESDK